MYIRYISMMLFCYIFSCECTVLSLPRVSFIHRYVCVIKMSLAQFLKNTKEVFIKIAGYWCSFFLNFKQYINYIIYYVIQLTVFTV